MRGHSITKAVSVTLVALGTCASLSACEPVYYGDGVLRGGGAFRGDGRTAISWTLNGTPFTEERCKTERIDAMNVFFLSDDEISNVEFTSVACGLDKYPAAMIPSGRLRVFVDAIKKPATGTRECVRYTGRATLTAGSQYPTTPTAVPLTLVNSCQ